MNFNDKLNNYANLIIRKGVNIQAGQPLVLRCPVELADFGRMLAKNAYEAGATEVIVNWADDALTLMLYENAPMEVFEEYPQWQVDKSKYYFEKNTAVISVSATDPELLKNVDVEKINAGNKSASIAMKDNMKYTMNDLNSWCVVAAPTAPWAKKIFPDLSDEEAIAKLWELIFYTTRADLDDPIAAWDEHVASMDAHAAFLNEKSFKYLHYTNELGTDLKVELPVGHVWLSAGSTNAKGTVFIANIPTEEVFTLPHKDGVNGVLYSTKPLNYGGNLIDGMSFTFVDGAVVEYDAKIGKEHLDIMFSMDDAAKKLGEVALVQYDSPISNSDVLFYNTLFDENASCHFAFGKAYPTCLEGGVDMSEEELAAHGVNDSLIHEDFMVGSEDLNIVGITEDGEEFQIFKDGNWAF